MQYNFQKIEKDWQDEWRKRETYKVDENTEKPKYYALDMFPYPSGAGLHVGHPLGYIASDVYSRYKRLKGFNVLHPMGYDAFGLPAEQYAIQTGQHPAVTTEANIATYRRQLDQLGFGYDWSREVRTCEPDYYKWTQWIFLKLFDSWYNNDTDKAEPVSTLRTKLAEGGSVAVNAHCDEHEPFTAEQWEAMTKSERNLMLLNYRLAYLSEAMVNWCPALGTVLANDEVKDGVSERGGHPVVQKKMKQWSMRITAYAQRLLDGLNEIDWSDSIKEIQRNWIGRSEGAMVKFAIDGHDEQIEVFTTRPDTIFGVTFMVLAPEHELVVRITTPEQKAAIEAYQEAAAKKSERDRMSDVKTVSGEFTGAYVVHPFSGKKVPIWIGDYVLASYGTGAVMAVPSGDQRDWNFATKFGLDIPPVIEGTNVEEGANDSKEGRLINSDFLNGMKVPEAIKTAIAKIEEKGIGKGTINYRLRNAVFGRQRYWGEPIPIYYEDGVPYPLKEEDLPLVLPEVDKFLPTEDGEPPLARAKDWKYKGEFEYEYTTMPGWAGSSWYYLRYMDAHNEREFVSKEKVDYWQNVDLYIGGAEHATGHLLYVRFWTKALNDLGYLPFDEPAKKLINQGMIQGVSQFIEEVRVAEDTAFYEGREKLLRVFRGSDLLMGIPIPQNEKNRHVHIYRSLNCQLKLELADALTGKALRTEVNSGHANVKFVGGSTVEGFYLNVEKWLEEEPVYYPILICDDQYWRDGVWYDYNGDISSDDKVFTRPEVEKMSKSKLNVVNPDDLVKKYGADTLRLYEMFLGPLTESKPWDVKGIEGTHRFLKKLWRLFHTDEAFVVSDEAPNKDELKALHKAIKKVEDDLNRFSFNTVVSEFMICVNELSDLKCNKREILEPLVVLVSPYAPHIAEELWQKLGCKTSVTQAEFPAFDASYLVEDSFEYPVSFNGKTRFRIELPATMSKEDVEKEVLAHADAQKWLDGNPPKKVIVVPKRIVNVVV